MFKWYQNEFKAFTLPSVSNATESGKIDAAAAPILFFKTDKIPIDSKKKNDFFY